MNERDLVLEKAGRAGLMEVRREIDRVRAAIPKAQSISARKRFETRLAIYQRRLNQLTEEDKR